VHAPYQAQQDKLVTFVDRAIGENQKLVVLEIGCGFNTPVVTRMPAESIARESGAPFIRINLTDCDFPQTPVAVCLAMDTTVALQLLSDKVQATGGHASTSWPRRRESDNGQWRKMLRRLQDPARPDKQPPLADWPRAPLTAMAISLDGGRILSGRALRSDDHQDVLER